MLAGKIVEPETSFFRISRAKFEEWDQIAREQGYGEHWRRTHEEREATRSKAMVGRFSEDLWIFAYGSLMWDPAIHVVEIRRAKLRGYHRRFCLKIKVGRGSREKPSLMAALDRDGECDGLAFRVPSTAVDRETEILWMREMIDSAYLPMFVQLDTPQGAIEALAFIMDRKDAKFVDIGLDEAARIIATGTGALGSNLEYFNNLAEHVVALGIEDMVFEGIRVRLPLQTKF
jgi:cation transport protein ChaC